MTVYVDDMRLPARVGRVEGRWSHLVSDLPGADGTAELVGFAQRLGVDPRWLQHPGEPTEHFDLTDPLRARALALGAVPIAYVEAGHLARAKRRGRPFDLVGLRARRHPSGRADDRSP